MWVLNMFIEEIILIQQEVSFRMLIILAQQWPVRFLFQTLHEAEQPVDDAPKDEVPESDAYCYLVKDIPELFSIHKF